MREERQQRVTTYRPKECYGSQVEGMEHFLSHVWPEACGRLDEYAVYVEARALYKLLTIISRYGDEGGERLKPYYLEQLMRETVQADALAAHCREQYERKGATQ